MIGGGNLQILNVKAKSSSDLESDDAKYMCRAENDMDSVDAEARLSVIGKMSIYYMIPSFNPLPDDKF